MNSDATQNRQRNSRTVLLIQEQPLLWEVAFFRGQQGSGLTSQDKGRSCVQASHGCHYCICSKRNNDFSGSSPPTLLYIITPVYQSPGASWVHRGFITSLEMSLQTGPSVSLLAQVFHLVATITAWMHQETHKPWRGGFPCFVCPHTE